MRRFSTVLALSALSECAWTATGFVAPTSLVYKACRTMQLDSAAAPPGIAKPSVSSAPPGIAKPAGSLYAPEKARPSESKATSSGAGQKTGYRYDPSSSGPETVFGPERMEEPDGMMLGPEFGGDDGYVPFYSFTKPIQGAGSREHFEASPERTLVNLGSGRPHSPVEAEVELWQGPGNTPQRVRTWSMDGWLRPFQAEFESSSRYGGYPGTMQVRNLGTMEFPAVATVEDTDPAKREEAMHLQKETIDGGALKTFQFDHSVDRVRVHLETDGLPLMAILELWQGPSNVQQVAEVYVDDGRESPFTTMIETPGYEFTGMSGSTIAIRNVGPITYPIKASLQPIGAGVSSQRPPVHENPPYPDRSGPYTSQGGGFSRSQNSYFSGRGPYASQGIGYPQNDSSFYTGRGPYASQGKEPARYHDWYSSSMMGGYNRYENSYYGGRTPPYLGGSSAYAAQGTRYQNSHYGGRTPPYGTSYASQVTGSSRNPSNVKGRDPSASLDRRSPQNLSNSNAKEADIAQAAESSQSRPSTSSGMGIYAAGGAAGSAQNRSPYYNGRARNSFSRSITGRQPSQHPNPYNSPNAYYSTPSVGSPNRDPRWYENVNSDGYCNVFNQN